MANTIWTNEELKQIKEILQSKMIFKKEKDGTIRLIDNRDNNQPFKGEYNVYSKILYNETVKLLESNDKEEIEKLVKKHSKTEFDSNNRLHYGLISALSRLNVPESTTKNSTYSTQIFIILKEIIGQYERIIKLVVDKYFNSITDPDEIRMYLNKIKNGELELNKEVLFLMQKVFSFTDKLNNEPIFKELINECNSKINLRIVNKVNTLLANAVKINQTKKTTDANFHKEQFRQKYRAHILGTAKKYYGGKL